MRFLVETQGRPLRRSCDCVGLSRSAWYAPPLDWTVRDAELIAALAKLDFQKDYDGDSMKAQIIAQEIKDTYARMHSEHIRNAKANLLYKPSTARKILSIIGNRPPWAVF